MKVKKLQKEIKNLVARLGWSYNKLARVIYVEQNEDDNLDEIAKFQETLKKQLSRETTKAELLHEYINIITNTPEFEKLQLIAPFYLTSNILDDETEKGLNDISELLDDITKSQVKI